MPGSNILHFGAVRVRAVGTGDLDLKLLSLDDVETEELEPVRMQTASSRKLDRLCNFVSQGARLRFGTDKINEHFKINDITIFVKELWSQFPSE